MTAKPIRTFAQLAKGVPTKGPSHGAPFKGLAGPAAGLELSRSTATDLGGGRTEARNDPWERQADRQASAVLASSPPSSLSVSPQNPEAGTTGSTAREPVRGDLPTAAESALLGTGQKLPDEARTDLESRFGHDFSRVRVHSGAAAAASTHTLGARAFTVGRDVVFGSGQYALSSTAGRRLLAHELTHVVQQQRSGVAVLQAQSADTGPKTIDPAALAKTMKPADFYKGAVENFELQSKIHSQVRGISGKSDLIKRLKYWRRSLEVTLQLLPKIPGNVETNKAKLSEAYRVAMEAVYRTYSEQVGNIGQVFRDHAHELAWGPKATAASANALSDAVPERVRRKIKVVTTTLLPSSKLQLPAMFPKKKKGVRPMKSSLQGGSEPKYNAAIVHGDLKLGLHNLAIHLITSIRPRVLTPNTTVTLALDLQPFGFEAAAYRFTFHEPALPGGKAVPTILIEKLGATGLEAQSPKEKKDAEKKFKAHSFSFSGRWDEEEKASVVNAVRITPDSILSLVDGLRFRRQSAHPTDSKAGGNYSFIEPRHTITLFNLTFASSQLRFGTPGEGLLDSATFVVAHEIGHAVDVRKPRQTLAANEVAKRQFQAKFGRYKVGENSYSGFPRNQQKEFNALLKKVNAQSSTTESGHEWVKINSEEDKLVPKKKAGTAFRKAAVKDGGTRISSYSDDSWEEYFAESFALYVTDQKTLEDLRPNVYQYFEGRFPKKAKGAKKKP